MLPSHTCGTGGEADFWKITKYVELNATFADVINVDVEAELKLCYDPGNGTDLPCHANYFEVYIYRGSGDTSMYSPKREDSNQLLTIYAPLYNITNNTVVSREPIRSNQTFSFPRNNAQGFVLAIRSRGACGSIYRMKMYYYYCEEAFINGIKFERTASPATGYDRMVKGICTGNTAPPNNGTTLNGNCTYNGTWNVDGNVNCTCAKNYTLDRGIGICLRKLYYTLSQSLIQLKFKSKFLNSKK